MSNKSLLPFVASSLNDVYSKLDGIANQLKQFGEQIDDFIGDLNKQFSDSIMKIVKMHDTLAKVNVLTEFKTSTKLIQATLDQVNESIWYVDFIIALKRILNVVQDIEI
ncbi:MAG: hypothetical protein ACTSRG_13425 [Candidatus Helarchaeota archaeon]